MGNPLVTAHTFDANVEQGGGTGIWSPKPYVPSGSGWSFTNDFEGGTLGQQTINGKNLCVYSNAEANSGTQSGACTIQSGNTGKGWGGGINFGVLGTETVPHGNEVWWRMYIFFPTSFSYQAGPVFKFMRWKWNPGGFTSTIVKSSGNINYSNDNVGSDWFQGTITADVGGRDNAGALGPKGTWHAYELYNKIHSTDGQGIERVWVNGVLTFENSTIRNCNSPTDSIAGCEFFNYWNSGAPQTQTSYVDDIKWTTQTPTNLDAAGNPMIGPIGWVNP